MVYVRRRERRTETVCSRVVRGTGASGGVPQNGSTTPPVVKIKDGRREGDIGSGSKTVKAAQYQLLKADASGRQVKEEG